MNVAIMRRSEVDAFGTHRASCRWSEAKHLRHAAVHDVIHKSLTAANIPSQLEPSGLYWFDRKCTNTWKQGDYIYIATGPPATCMQMYGC